MFLGSISWGGCTWNCHSQIGDKSCHWNSGSDNRLQGWSSGNSVLLHPNGKYYRTIKEKCQLIAKKCCEMKKTTRSSQNSTCQNRYFLCNCMNWRDFRLLLEMLRRKQQKEVSALMNVKITLKQRWWTTTITHKETQVGIVTIVGWVSAAPLTVGRSFARHDLWFWLDKSYLHTNESINKSSVCTMSKTIYFM